MGSFRYRKNNEPHDEFECIHSCLQIKTGKGPVDAVLREVAGANAKRTRHTVVCVPIYRFLQRCFLKIFY